MVFFISKSVENALAALAALQSGQSCESGQSGDRFLGEGKWPESRSLALESGMSGFQCSQSGCFYISAHRGFPICTAFKNLFL